MGSKGEEGREREGGGEGIYSVHTIFHSALHFCRSRRVFPLGFDLSLPILPVSQAKDASPGEDSAPVFSSFYLLIYLFSRPVFMMPSCPSGDRSTVADYFFVFSSHVSVDAWVTVTHRGISVQKLICFYLADEDVCVSEMETAVVNVVRIHRRLVPFPSLFVSTAFSVDKPDLEERGFANALCIFPDI